MIFLMHQCIYLPPPLFRLRFLQVSSSLSLALSCACVCSLCAHPLSPVCALSFSGSQSCCRTLILCLSRCSIFSESTVQYIHYTGYTPGGWGADNLGAPSTATKIVTTYESALGIVLLQRSCKSLVLSSLVVRVLRVSSLRFWCRYEQKCWMHLRMCTFCSRSKAQALANGYIWCT